MFEGSADRVWVLDPIDGTKGFMRGEHYCIALALLVKGEHRIAIYEDPTSSLYESTRTTPTAILGPYGQTILQS